MEKILSPLISVIIPCYNHSHYLPEAIESVLKQTYPAVEIIVVDDGSWDRTAEVAASYPQVRYIYQQNQGLSAARNTGIHHSQGEMLVFLDADDWLYPEALETNLQYLLQNPQAAFVSGAYDNVLIEENVIKEEVREVASNHYQQLLNRNYVGMIAAVMYRRWVFDEFLYDESLKACEDYNIYLEITREYPVVHHTVKTAAYRIYSSNMSSNIPRMLSTVLRVLKRQRKNLRTVAEKQAYQRGLILWKNYYCFLLYENLVQKKIRITKEAIYLLVRYSPLLYLKYIVKHHLIKLKFTLF